MKDRDPKDSAIMYVEDSLNRLREHYIGIDIQSVDLCVTLLREYVDKLECREDVKPEVPEEIEAMILLLCKVSSDLELTKDVLIQDVCELDKSLA